MPKWNGKEVETAELQKIVKNPKAMVKELTVGLTNPNKKQSELTDSGVSLSQEYTQALLQQMIETNAEKITVKFTGVPELLGKTLIITIQDPDQQ